MVLYVSSPWIQGYKPIGREAILETPRTVSGGKKSEISIAEHKFDLLIFFLIQYKNKHTNCIIYKQRRKQLLNESSIAKEHMRQLEHSVSQT